MKIILALLLFASVAYADEIIVQVKFTENVEVKTGDIRQFTDALTFTKADYDNMTKEDIDAMKKSRVENFKRVCLMPSVEPTKEQYEQELAFQKDQVSRITSEMIKKGYIEAVN